MKKGLLQGGKKVYYKVYYSRISKYIFNLDKVWSSDSELLETLRQYWKDIREP